MSDDELARLEWLRKRQMMEQGSLRDMVRSTPAPQTEQTPMVGRLYDLLMMNERRIPVNIGVRG